MNKYVICSGFIDDYIRYPKPRRKIGGIFLRGLLWEWTYLLGKLSDPVVIIGIQGWRKEKAWGVITNLRE